MIRRRVWVVCDGPCGKTLEASKVPEGWVYLRIQVPGKEMNQESAVLCPECQGRVRAALTLAKIALSKKTEEVLLPEKAAEA